MTRKIAMLGGTAFGLAAMAITCWPLMAQVVGDIDRARDAVIAAARATATRRAHDLADQRGQVAATWDKVNSCAEVGAFERKYGAAGYLREIANARHRYCEVKHAATPLTPVRATLAGFAGPSRNSDAELMINGQTVRLAEVMECKPGSGMSLNDLVKGGQLYCSKSGGYCEVHYPTTPVNHALTCRPSGDAYNCTINETGEDLASLAVSNGVIQPRAGEEYTNEYYAWRELVDNFFALKGTDAEIAKMREARAAHYCSSGR